MKLFLCVLASMVLIGPACADPTCHEKYLGCLANARAANQPSNICDLRCVDAPGVSACDLGCTNTPILGVDTTDAAPAIQEDVVPNTYDNYTDQRAAEQLQMINSPLRTDADRINVVNGFMAVAGIVWVFMGIIYAAVFVLGLYAIRAIFRFLFRGSSFYPEKK